jgi:hypothetical protein
MDKRTLAWAFQGELYPAIKLPKDSSLGKLYPAVSFINRGEKARLHLNVQPPTKRKHLKRKQIKLTSTKENKHTTKLEITESSSILNDLPKDLQLEVLKVSCFSYE